MRPCRARRSLGLALALATSASTARAASFELTAQDRQVDVAITGTTLQCFPPPTGCTPVGSPTHYADSLGAPDFSAFSATASVPSINGYSASQTSSLSPGSLQAHGSGLHTGSGGFSAPPNIYTTSDGSSDSHFEASFDVATPTSIHLTGKVSANGGLSANSNAQIRLRTAGGTTIAEVVASTDPNCMDNSCAVVGPIPLDYTSVLAPGSYVLEASTSGSASPFFFANNFITLASTGEYHVELANTAVPALGPFALGALALSLALAASPLLARSLR
ncbi:MAG TPA: hypothetical protein VMW19_09090 [Myxococcota bacterium]|nr:hypothetical protein [Myxococcota bacterium]